MERTGRQALRLDLLFYGASLAFASVTALFAEFYGYRIWGNFATVGYLLALALTVAQFVSRTPKTGWLWSRWTPVAVTALLACVVPLLVLILKRSPNFVWGDWTFAWPAQPEVWVIERSARLLLETGTPYADLSDLGRPVDPDDYTPYGPAMTVYGLPRALFGDSPLTDGRVAFLLATVLVIVLILKVMGWPKIPVLAAQLAVISPLTLLMLTVAGDDIPVILLIVLAAALAFRKNPVWAGVAIAVVINMKLTALPALGVLAMAVLAVKGWRALLILFGTVLITSAVLVLPVLLVDPAAFVEHVVMFPAGLAEASSPAASPLPGNLISRLGPGGHAASLVVLAAAACALAAWLVVRPPRDYADIMLRTAVGLGTAIVLTPATRWGYLAYPLALVGAMVAFRETAEKEGTRTPAGPTGDRRDVTHDDVASQPVASPDTRGIQA